MGRALTGQHAQHLGVGSASVGLAVDPFLLELGQEGGEGPDARIGRDVACSGPRRFARRNGLTSSAAGNAAARLTSSRLR